jgi:hypothetical protein
MAILLYLGAATNDVCLFVSVTIFLNRLQLGTQTLLPLTNAWDILDYTLNHFVMVIICVDSKRLNLYLPMVLSSIITRVFKIHFWLGPWVWGWYVQGPGQNPWWNRMKLVSDTRKLIDFIYFYWENIFIAYDVISNYNKFKTCQLLDTNSAFLSL